MGIMEISTSALVALTFVLITILGLKVGAGRLNNVVVFISDDLSAFHLDPNHPAKMPSIAKLGERGVKFTNAHSNFPVCGPSRMSFMTGRYAEATKLYTFDRFVPQVPGLTTMAQYLASKHGYETVAFGKVFHEDHTPDAPVAQAMFEAGMWTTKQMGGGSNDNECHMQWYCMRPDSISGDMQLSTAVISYMSGRNTSKPLAAFIGFRKPHLDIGVPSEYLTDVSVDQNSDPLLLSTPPSLGAGNVVIPFEKSLQRFECFYEIAKRRLGHKRAYPSSFLLGAKSLAQLQEMRRYYFAAIRFVDDMISRVVNFIDASDLYKDNTAIVYFADHGFAMSEHGMFCKNALFEQQTRVPLVVVPARNENFAGGLIRTDPVGLVDVFPTVIRLATGTTLSANAIVDASNIPLSGRSLLEGQTAIYTFSLYPRCDSVSRKAKWECVIAVKPCKRVLNKWMGYMVRTSTQRYVEWRNFDDITSGCSRAVIPGVSPSILRRLPRVKQVDPVKSGGRWDLLPVQRELFVGYANTTTIKWNDWEYSNLLVDKINDLPTIRMTLELSAAIKWRFDPSFSPNGREQPCSNNGYVRLKNPSSWNSFSVDPTFRDIQCICLPHWTGPLCATRAN